MVTHKNILTLNVLFTTFVLLILINLINCFNQTVDKDRILNDVKFASSSETYPYVVAILKKSSFLSTGVLLTDVWVLSCADALYTQKEITRILRVRLGSTNYKKDGILLPVKWCDVHPFFDNINPDFDMGLLALAQPVKLSDTISPINILNTVQAPEKDVYLLKHFDVPAWYVSGHQESENGYQIYMNEELMRRRTLQYAQITPLNYGTCTDVLNEWMLNYQRKFVCLKPDPLSSRPCARRLGAPLVHKNVLWGIISSWIPQDCSQDSPMLANLVSSPYISDWILATTAGQQWNMMINYQETDVDSEIDEDYNKLMDSNTI